MLFPAIWWFRRLDWGRYPLGLDVVYLSIYALDMAGNSFNLYDTRPYFDLVPHFHATGAASLVIAVYWARTRHPDALERRSHGWLVETTLVAAGIATMIHVLLEIQEYYTDVLAGTINVGGVADTVNDLAVGLVGALVYPPLAVRWFLGRFRVGWLGAVTIVLLVIYTFVVFANPGPAIADAIADRVATEAPAGGLPAEVHGALLAAAQARAADPPARGPGDEVRHAHDSVTVDELQDALTGGYHSIEGDVGLAGSLPVMRHDVRDPVEITFREWLEVVAAADFELVKVDVKRDRVDPIIEDLRYAVDTLGLDECRLTLNADVLEGPGAYADFSFGERLYTRIALKLEPDDLERLGLAFPCATVSVSAWVGPTEDGARYEARHIEQHLEVVRMYRAAGLHEIVVAARWDLLDDAFVEAMRAARVRVDVWNSLAIASPADAEAEAARLRERYGDALRVIDLRR
jgi:hypothetical protein